MPDAEKVKGAVFRKFCMMVGPAISGTECFAFSPRRRVRVICWSHFNGTLTGPRKISTVFWRGVRGLDSPGAVMTVCVKTWRLATREFGGRLTTCVHVIQRCCAVLNLTFAIIIYVFCLMLSAVLRDVLLTFVCVWWWCTSCLQGRGQRGHHCGGDLDIHAPRAPRTLGR